MADETSSNQVWAVMHRAAQQIMDELRLRDREIDPLRIGMRVARLLADVPGVSERVPALIRELRERVRAARRA